MGAATLLLAFLGTSAPPSKADGIPPEPDKAEQRKLWEGFYNAERMYLYHFNKATAAHKQANLIKGLGILLTTISLAPNFFKSAPKARTKKSDVKEPGWVVRAWRQYAPTVFPIGRVAVFGTGLFLATFTANVDQQTHTFLATEWNDLGNEWNDARDNYKAGKIANVDEVYTHLRSKQSAIEAKQPIDLYDEKTMTQAETQLKNMLGLRNGSNS